jgi:Xaa-Pro dipeptidase
MDQTVNTAHTLYKEHLSVVMRRFDTALEQCGFDAVVIGSGTAIYRFLDDQTYPFIPNPHFVQWLPIATSPECCVIHRPGERPELIICQPDDYWYKSAPLPGAPWIDGFDLLTIGHPDELSPLLSSLPVRTAFIGDVAQWRHRPAAEQQNPKALLNHLHYQRPTKTRFEIECIRLATQRAVPAHLAAGQAFRDGAAEYDILMAFLRACRQTEAELPYPAIIATNANGAVLHYQHYEREVSASNSLLIDAACSAYGYASDITRTHVLDSKNEFANMVTEMDAMQQTICQKVRPGVPFGELHDMAHRAIAGLLKDWGLVALDADELIESGVSATFFPHGLGHFLGIQVHEVGGSFADPSGAEIPRPEQYPHLRLVRTLEADQVLTIEPGIYFIDSLLDKLKAQPVAKAVNWKLIDELKKFGGIRIEDNVVVTATGADNLTRQAFSAAR